MIYNFKLTYTPDDPDFDKRRAETVVEADSLLEAAKRGLVVILPRVTHVAFVSDEMVAALDEFVVAEAEDRAASSLESAGLEWVWGGNDGLFNAELAVAT